MSTKGELRVGLNFNPAAIPEIDQLKGSTAAIIDILDQLDGRDRPELARCVALAQTKYEEACMFAVKALVIASQDQDIVAREQAAMDQAARAKARARDIDSDPAARL